MTKTVQVFLFALCLCLVGTHRPQQLSSLGLEDDPFAEETDEADYVQPDEATAEPPAAGGSQKVFTAGPGLMGIHIDRRSGKILRVYKGSGAEKLGWKVGQKITQVGNHDYSFRLYAQIVDASAKHSKPYKISIDTAESDTAVEWVAWYSALPAGITGLSLVLACPWFIYQVLRSGLDAGSKALDQRVMWLLFVVAAGHSIGKICEQLSSLTLAGLFYGMAVATYRAGNLLGYFWNAGHSLLDTSLSKDVARQVRKADTIVLVFFFAMISSIVGKAVSVFVLSRQTNIRAAIVEFLLNLQQIPIEFVQIQFYWMMSRICAAAQQGMLEVAEALPCHAAEFEDNVHEPSAKLLKEIPPQLITCGAPLVLLALSIPGIIIWFYDAVWSLILLQNAVLQHWTFSAPQFFHIGWGICNMALTPCVVAVGPFWLSSSLKELKAKLDETRRRDPAMQLQVNHGQGWGIPVFDDFVLSKSTLQMICLRVLLAGTVIKAVLDAELGLVED
eukprot:Skav220316  [mRNA]  locus=scaffold972:33713:35385:- [translate_table: standard]